MAGDAFSELWKGNKRLAARSREGAEILAGLKRVIQYGELKGALQVAEGSETGNELRFTFSGISMYARYRQSFRKSMIEFGTWEQAPGASGAANYYPHARWDIDETSKAFGAPREPEAFYQAMLEVLEKDAAKPI